MRVSKFNIEYETWSPAMGGNGVSGTIRTTPENYYVATIDNSGKIFFTDIESMTKDVDKKRVKELWEKNKIPKRKQK